MSILDELPVATVTFLASIALIAVGYISNDIGFKEAWEALALAGGASFGIGYVRNGAGKGIRR